MTYVNGKLFHYFLHATMLKYARYAMCFHKRGIFLAIIILARISRACDVSNAMFSYNNTSDLITKVKNMLKL